MLLQLLSMMHHVYGLHCLWIALSMDCLVGGELQHGTAYAPTDIIYDTSCLWSALSVNCNVYGLCFPRNVNCLVYELSCLCAVLFINSDLSMNFIVHEMSNLCPAYALYCIYKLSELGHAFFSYKYYLRLVYDLECL